MNKSKSQALKKKKKNSLVGVQENKNADDRIRYYIFWLFAGARWPERDANLIFMVNE